MHPIQYFLILSFLLLFAGLSKIFEKAGEQGWKAWIPVYHFVIWLRILKKPWWWIFLIIIPTISWLMLFVLFVETAKAFGKRDFKEHCLALFGYFIYLPWLGFSKENTFVGPPDQSAEKKTFLREWGEAGLFAIVAATIIRTFFIEAFTIPTSSLEKSLLIGDYLFVSKVSYGAKVPNTPLSFPFAHNVLPFTETVPSYLEWVKLPNLRLPGMGHVQRNDYVVFNFPEGDTVVAESLNGNYYTDVLVKEEYKRRGAPALQNMSAREAMIKQDQVHLLVRPVDKEDNYVKRCVAIPGDKLEIIDSKLFINGEPSYVSENMQYKYIVKTSPLQSPDGRPMSGLNRKMLAEKFDMTEQIEAGPDSTLWRITLPFKNVEKLQAANPNIISITPDIAPKGEYRFDVFPHSPAYAWNIDNYGPLTVPKQGVTVALDTMNLPIYRRIINVYEGNKLEQKGASIFINGQEAHSYTFKQNYYFMMGDNRHNSADSRFWGFTPEDHIVGKPVFIWLSRKKDVPLMKSFRMERMFTFVQGDHISKSYLLYALLIGGGIWAFFNFRGKKQTGGAKDILNKGDKK
jgi:signal peptidase I